MLEKLSPRVVFHWFELLSAIPHGSRDTKAISDWCAAFAADRKLTYRQDDAGNIVIYKHGSRGAENEPPLILQGHLDMVCAKESGSTVDMSCESIQLCTDGSDVWADGTTLGADNGIAVAMILSLLDASDIVHPPLEAVLTVDEEIGMKGAAQLDMSWLKGRRMINLDSEREGEIFAGCAGGNKVTCHLPVVRIPASGDVWDIHICGLQGGHSGIDIHKGRACAIRLLGRVLYQLSCTGTMHVIDAFGGQADNAIADEAHAVVAVQNNLDVKAVAAEMENELRTEYRVTEPTLRIEVCHAENTAPMLDKESTGRLLCMLQCVPQGVEEMSADVPGLPQTSANFGILRVNPEEIYGEFCVRSALVSQKQMMNQRIKCLTKQLGGSTACSIGSPVWAFCAESPLRDCCRQAYCDLYGNEPEVKISHAGAECGIFAAGIDGLDCVSIGPNITFVHTPKERLEVASVENTWKYLLKILALMCEKH